MPGNQFSRQCDPSAAGRERFTRHEARVFAEQEANYRGDLVGLADPAQRRLTHDVLHHIIGENVGHLGFDQTRGNAIDADIMRGKGIKTAAAGQRDDTRLGRGVMDLQFLRGRNAATDDIKTILPKPRAIISSLTAKTTKNAPFKFTLIVSSQSSYVRPL